MANLAKIPVTYTAGYADLIQRHEHFAAHTIEALQEQAPENFRQAQGRRLRLAMMPKFST